MVDKRGWLRIVEALVSILIVFGAVLTVSITKQAGSPNDVCSIISPFLEEISRNQTLRMQILNNNSIETEQFLSSHIKNPSLEMNVKICEADNSLCPHDISGYDNVDICAEERLISGNVGQNFVVKRLKVFLFKIS